MSASMSSDSTTEPNLTPILDMVFQLITFFMLVINIKNASIDEKLKLPIVGSARVVDSKGQDDLLVLNINKEGEVVVYGVKRELEKYIALEAKASLKLAQQANPAFKAGTDLPSSVVIRADRELTFDKLHRVIEACQNQHFTKFQFRGLNKEPEKK